MSSSDTFAEYIVSDVFGGFENIAARKMFGGYGIYQNKKIFAIIVDDELYLKGEEDAEKFFLKKGSQPFRYTKKDGKTYTMRYYHVPGEILEDRETFDEWIRVIDLK
jgi:DNA transformation protein and related proteins